MSDSYKRIPGDDEYFKMLGIAIMAFQRLEWDVLYCCDRLSRDFIRNAQDNLWTSMQSAKGGKKKKGGGKSEGAKELFARVSDRDLRDRLSGLIDNYIKIVDDRNQLVHADPATKEDPSGGNQRLIYQAGSKRKVWFIDDLEKFSSECVDLGSYFNSILHNELKEGHNISLEDLRE